jgi:hypothetical protein
MLCSLLVIGMFVSFAFGLALGEMQAQKSVINQQRHQLEKLFKE